MRIPALALTVFLASAALFAQTNLPGQVQGVAGHGVPYPEVDLPFQVGETLEYNIYWGWIHVGTSRNTTRWVWQDDRWLLEIRLRTRSNSVLTKLYPVDDTIISVVDPLKKRPVTFTKIINEGKHHKDEFTVFNWEEKRAYFTRTHRTKDKIEKKEYDLEDNTRDLGTFLYFMRGIDLKAKSKYNFDVMADEKLWDLDVETGKIKNIKLKKYGKVPSVEVKPRAKFQGIFVRKGEMTLYVSQDDRNVLTRMVADTPFANVKLLLYRVQGPGTDFWIEKGKEPDSEEPKKKPRRRRR